jgi:hypothetical protein
MEEQSQIKRTLATPESIELIRRLLADGTHANRSSLAHATCEHFGLLDACGRTQTAGCVKALRELERSGHFTLPAVIESGRAKARLPGDSMHPCHCRRALRRKPATCAVSR